MAKDKKEKKEIKDHVMKSKEIAVGLTKGHPVTKNVRVQRPSRRKGKLHKHVKFVRDLVREVRKTIQIS